MPASTRRAPRASLTAPPPAEPVGPPTEPAGAPPLAPERRGLLRRKPETAPPVAATATASTPKTAKAGSWPWLDVVAAAAVALVAAFTSSTGSEGGVRLLFGLAMLLFVPGYLLLQAFAVPVPSGQARLWQALASLGISPALVGVLALVTSVVQGAFRLDAILILVTLTCLGFAAAAIVRRRALAHATLRPNGVAKHSAATAKSGTVRP